MTILIIDTDYNIVNTLNLLKNIEPNWNILESDGTLNKYNNNIDLVIVDFSIPLNRDILNDIINIKQNQKTITASTELSCSVLEGCDVCIQNYDRRRLMQPIDINSLYKTIKYFEKEDCLYSNTDSFHNIELILPLILNRFSSYNYDQTTKILHPRSYTDDVHLIKDMISITEILSTHNIKYNLTNDSKIEIFV